MGYLYVTRFGLAGAIPKVTAGIRAYNQSQNIVDTPTSGYHETMTLAWLHLVAAMLAVYAILTGAVTPTAHSASSPPRMRRGGPPRRWGNLQRQTQLHEKKLLRLFYSRERFCSPEAKYSFVPPDLAPLPRAHAHVPG